MGTHVTGWIGAMGLNHGDMWQWLDQGDGIVSWGHATLAGAGQWGWFMAVCGTGWNGMMGLIHGACHGGTRYWLDQGDGINLWGCAVGHATQAGSGRWDWFMRYVMGAHDWIGAMGLIWGGTPLGCDAGCDTSWGHDWIREMGLICGGTPWRCDTGWMWIMRLIYRGIPWGAQLDRGDGIALWRLTMGVHDTG